MGIFLKRPLVSTEWLENNLEADDLRVFDTSVTLSSNPNGYGYEALSGLEYWRDNHIPGAGYLDLLNDLSKKNCETSFMMPSTGTLVVNLEQSGIDDSSTVVLYNVGTPMWSTRVWWMLRSIGLTNVAVLDGGWDKWKIEGRATSSSQCKYPKGRITGEFNKRMWVGKKAMFKAVQKREPLTLNALSPAVYSGEKNQYGRAGHLPGSWNVYYADVLDSRTGVFRKRKELAEKFGPSGALKADRVITYCGGGISATVLCLALHLCGQNSVAVYDGSMSEWVRDEALPLKSGMLP